MANIIIIDDEISICGVINKAVSTIGHTSDHALTIKDGYKKALEYPADIIFLDINLPDGNGIDWITMLKNTPSAPEVIVITGEDDPDNIETAIHTGVWDYLPKPFTIEEITSQIEGIMQYREEKKDAAPEPVMKRDGIIGSSPQITESLKLAADASSSDINVLISGETGTGKEQFAVAIHTNSSRSKNNFVIVDCAALPETLVESTLFGHIRGAFTGSDRDQEGLIKQANGGTLFLDEIGELPLSVQKAFLRVLQERNFRPVGSKKVIYSDFRLIAATNRDLGRMVSEGTFREDLYFRIKSMLITLPPLKERFMDIKELADFFIEKTCKREGTAVKKLSSQLIDMLQKYNWPGNVRELSNAIQWAVIKARYESTIFPKHLPEQIRIKATRSSIVRKPAVIKTVTQRLQKVQLETLPRYKEFRKQAILDREKDYLNDLISLTDGNMDMACTVSGLGRTRLYDLMKNHGITRSC